MTVQCNFCFTQNEYLFRLVVSLGFTDVKNAKQNLHMSLVVFQLQKETKF